MSCLEKKRNIIIDLQGISLIIYEEKDAT